MKYEALKIIRQHLFNGARRAYVIRKVRDIDEQVAAGVKEVEDIVSPSLLKLAEHEGYLDWCRRTLAGKFGQEQHSDIEQAKFDWLEDLDVQRTIRSKKQLIAISDFMLDDVELLTEQMKKNLDHANGEFERFEAAKRLVVPIMQSQGCSWGKAVEQLRGNGTI